MMMTLRTADLLLDLAPIVAATGNERIRRTTEQHAGVGTERRADPVVCAASATAAATPGATARLKTLGIT